MVTTAKNAALDILRVERKTTAFPENWEPPAREDSQPEYNYLVALIRTLPENYRRILELNWWKSRLTGRSPIGCISMNPP